MPENLTITYEVKGSKALIKALIPSRLYAGEVADTIRRAAIFARKTAAGSFDRNSPAFHSILMQVLPMQARVFSEMSEARVGSIEEGRPAGAPLLHPDALENWEVRVGARGTSFEIARAIKRRGVKGRFFMRRAIQDTVNILPAYLAQAASKIRNSFPKR